jgi:hypothetical protein
MHGLRIKIPSKKSRQQRCAEGFNSVVKGLRSTRINAVAVQAVMCVAAAPSALQNNCSVYREYVVYCLQTAKQEFSTQCGFNNCGLQPELSVRCDEVGQH